MKRPQDGRLEVRNIDFLKEGLVHHTSLLTHLAAIVHRDHFYILYEYSEYGSLETFLHEGEAHQIARSAGHDRQGSYDFAQRFPNYEPSALFEQMKDLVGALKFLHGELQITGSPGTYCAHLDLKPNNILIFPGGPVGTWKIIDFGLSSFKSRFKVIRDLTADDATPSETLRDREGTHFAPELHSHYRGNITEREADVWSVGCILAEVITFASGRAKLVQQFEDFRCKTSSNDYFFKIVDRRDINSRPQVLSWEGKQFLLKTEITDWVDKLEHVPIKYCNMVKTILVPNFVLRPSSAEIYDLFLLTADSPNPTPPARPASAQQKWILNVGRGVRNWNLSANGETVAYLYDEQVIQFHLDGPQGKKITESHGLTLAKLGVLSMRVAGSLVLIHGFDKKSGKLEVRD